MRKVKFLYSLALAAVVITTLEACAQDQPERSADNAAAMIQAPMSAANTLSGNYLAGRFAQHEQDWGTAQNYMGAVLEHDSGNSQMVQRTFLLALGSGNFVKARQLAEKISGTKENSELALIFLSCDAIGHDQFAEAIRYLDKLPAEGFGQYTKPLLTAWALMGQGKKSAALKLLTANSGTRDPTFHMHVGMMEEMSGNMNAAAQHYKITMENGLDLHTAIMIGNFYERYGQPEITRNIYESLDKIYPFSPFVSAMLSRDPHRVISPNIAHAADGAALALLDLATLLYGKRAYDSAQIYGSMVTMLAPASPYAKLMMGDIAALHNQYGKAVESYDSIDTASPVFWLSRMRVAEIYELDGKLEKSIQMLTAMSKDSATRTPALVSLGDIYRRHSQFEEAVNAYDQALAGIAPVTQDQWPIIYARGIAKERLKHWDMAEKDLLHALALQPGNPMILNFLAYSWADQGINLDKALKYAQQAAALRPHDGYILDSYGWTLFRLEKYQESISWLEQAVEQIPNDTTLLDHLGDAYWQVGRKSEAQYQWKHAGDLSHDPAFKNVVQEKIRSGIVVPSQVEHQQAKL